MNGQCTTSMTWAEFTVAMPILAGFAMAALVVAVLYLMYRLGTHQHVHPECPTEAQQKLNSTFAKAVVGLGLLTVFGIPAYLFLQWGANHSLGFICSTFM